MSVFEHSRREIYSAAQHPLRHTLDDFNYSNPALPSGTTTIAATLDYLFAVLYPKTKPAVATPADLPLVGNTINDYRVVGDDGDGKAAGYRWEKRETELNPSWHKIYDMDWGVDGILQAWELDTIGRYVFKLGYDDRDASGQVIVGPLAGQSVYGGASANTNLTLFANSGDGTGPNTGFIQFGDHTRPLADSTWSLGTTDYRWLKVWTDEITSGTLTLTSGSITDSSKILDFSDNDLVTDGKIFVGSLTLEDAQITSTTGTVDFVSDDITTLGSVTADFVSATTAVSEFMSGTTIGTLTLSDGKIVDSSGTVSFDTCHVTTTGNLTGAILTATTKVVVDNLTLDGNTVLGAGALGLILDAALGSEVHVNKTLNTLNISTTGNIDASGWVEGGNLRLDGQEIVNTAAGNSSIVLRPAGTGGVITYARVSPATVGLDLGTTTNQWGTLYFNTALSDGTVTMTKADLMRLRVSSYRDVGKTTPAQAGDSLFYDAVNDVWLASKPDTEIDHSTISGLTTGDAGHTQFVMLTGRVGGQTIQGGTLAGQNLYLESTSNATKGSVFFTDHLRPTSDAVYSSGWLGTDIGGASNRVRNLYTAGEAIGLRMENVGALPSSSLQNVGRLVFLTGENKAYVDDGTAFVKMGANKFMTDTVWNGTDTTKTVTVTTTGMDARKSIWALYDNTNDFEQIYAKITKTSATSVTITTNIPLTAGSYRLIGLE